MNRMFRVIGGGATLAALAACGPTVRSDRDENIPVPRGATWAWGLRDTTASARRGPVSSEIVQQRFQRAIEETMQAKGYHEVGDTSQADFVLTSRFGERRDATAPVAGRMAVGVGVYGGWGYQPWGFYRPWGYRPFGFYHPWGWGWYGAPVWGGVVAPAYPVGYRSYEDGALIVVLRHRATGYVAWTGRVTPDQYGSRRLSQERVQEIVNQLFKDLR
jgi:hypothetical protein